jgi:hypothetical protein
MLPMLCYEWTIYVRNVYEHFTGRMIQPLLHVENRENCLFPVSVN